MSKPYQIENRRAMQRFEASLRENQEPVQLLLPSVEIALAMKQGVGELIRQAGLQLMQLVMERDVEQMLGPRYEQVAGRRGWRWGKEEGWRRIDGQKVPLDRLRVRNVEGGDIPLGSYLCFQHDPHLALTALAGRDAGPVDAPIRTGGAAVRRRLRDGEVGGQRAVH